MDDPGQGRYTGQAPLRSALARPAESQLSRRTFIGRLGLAASVGLTGLAAACGGAAGTRQDGGREGRAAGTDTPEANGDTAARRGDGQEDGGREEQAVGADATGAEGGTVGVGCIGVFVRDLRASLGFYRRLGLDIPEDAGGGGYAYRLRLPTGQVFFWESYRAVRDFDPGWQPSSGNRRMVLEFGFATPEALNDKYAELTSRGYEGHLDPFTFAGSTVRYALIRDPDGNEVGMRYPEC